MRKTSPFLSAFVIRSSKMEAWCRDDDEWQPDSAIGGKPPTAPMNGYPATVPA